ncbi:expressed unknown protein [Seminavis robusta]|uniref:Uncharacterized protein n=1 Tax=Seminavis robusta TaxID=568900 RepID=A0A9N8E325_9STRA|nr:expressed unknown protein [Seminavis robusta]CAB9525713.1 expressed unknown protein [Seminavis robusta]|eukprot:Sro1716_g293150.1 n/a (309) ;mRNA; r:6226-7152
MIAATTPSNSKPLVVTSTADTDTDDWAGVISKLEMSSSDDESDSSGIDVDDYIAGGGKFASVVDVDNLTCRTETTAPEDSASDSVTSFGSHSEEQDDGLALLLEEEEEEPVITPTKFRKMRSSIKLASLQEVIPVKEKRGSWKQLPKPDMAKLQRAQTLPTYLSNEDQEQAPKRGSGSSVSFLHVCVRSYDQTIGDNPSVSYGPPICLDWKFEELCPVSVDDYEENRGERRQLKQMGLSYYHRMAILQNAFGHSEDDLKKAQKRANSDKMKRELTRFLLPMQALEDVAQSAGRKTKRYLQRRRQSSTV